MRCRKWEVWISRWHTGDLGPEDEAALLKHLAACPRCRAVEEQFRAVERLFVRSPAPPVPPFLNEKIVLRVREEMRQRTEGFFTRLLLFRFHFVRHALILGLSTAGVLLGVVVGSSLTQSFRTPAGARPFDVVSCVLPSESAAGSTFEFIWTDN